MADSTEDAMALRELVPAEPLLPDAGIPPWVWFAAAAAVLGLALLVIFFRRARTSAEDPAKARQEAYVRAKAALESAPGGGIQQAATRVSVTLRRYLADVCGDPALFETHEEFVARHQVLEKYPADLRKVTAEGFSHLARLKYGPDATGDPAALFNGARQLLDRLHQHHPA